MITIYNVRKFCVSKMFNATVSMHRTCLAFVVIVSMVFSQASAQTVIQIGTGTATPSVATNPGSGANGASPYGVNVSSGSGGKKLQIIYTASDINAAMVAAGYAPGASFISTTSWDISSHIGVNISHAGYTIKMANVSQTNFVSAATPYTGAMTTVFGPTAVSFGASGTGYLVTNNLTTIFQWDGTSSLLVEVCYTYSGVGFIGTYGGCRRTATSGNQMIYNGGASVSCGTSTYATAVAAIPNMKITVTSATPCTGAPAVSSAADITVCPNTSGVIGLTGLVGASGYSYLWLQSSSSTYPGTFVPASGTNNASTYATPTTLPFSPTFYVCEVTCSNSGLMTPSNPGSATVNSFLNCYCPVSYAAANGGTRGITQVILNGIPNIDNITAINSTAPYYTLYTAASPVSNAGLAVSTAYTLSVRVGSQTASSNNVGAWIDYDQNGVFSISEFIGSFASAAANSTTNINFTVPITALTGTTAMRIRHRYGGAVTSADPCTAFSGTAGTGGSGETEDYRVNIASCVSPSVQASGNTMGTINTTDATINWSGNGNGDAVLVVLNQGSAPAGPSQATAYTGNNNYPSAPVTSGTSRVVYTGTGSSVNVTGLVSNVTYFYSIYTYFSATNCYNMGSPASGSFTTANSPMTYLSSTTTQAVISNVTPGSVNNQIIGVQVVTSTGTSPALSLTSLTFNTTGSTLASDIAAAKVWYTGTSSTFATGTQFGSTVATPSGSHTVSGSITLSPGTNYFWVSYDIAASPTIGDVVDAQCTSIDVGGAQTPTVTAPAGSRTILLVYCTPSPGATGCSLGGDAYMTDVSFVGPGLHI